MSTAIAQPDTDQPVDLSPTNLMGKPLRPNYGMKHAAQALKGADIQIRYNPNAALRSEQGAAVRMFIEEQRAALYLQTRQGTIKETERIARTGDLNRIRDGILHSMVEWAGDMNPRDGSMGTEMAPEFHSACRAAFNRIKDVLNVQIKVRAVPTGPISVQKTEEQPIEVPVDLKLSDLDAVEQPLDSGPLNEQSVLEAGLQQPDLPVFVEPDLVETSSELLEILEEQGEEDSDVHLVRSNEVSPPESGDDSIRDIE